MFPPHLRSAGSEVRAPSCAVRPSTRLYWKTYTVNPTESRENSPFWEIFRRTVRAQLQLKGLRQRDLAIGIGESQGKVSKWLTGVANPAPDDIKRIAEFLDVSVESLASPVPDGGEFCVVPRRLLSEILKSTRNVTRKLEQILQGTELSDPTRSKESDATPRRKPAK